MQFVHCLILSNFFPVVMSFSESFCWWRKAVSLKGSAPAVCSCCCYCCVTKSCHDLVETKRQEVWFVCFLTTYVDDFRWGRMSRRLYEIVINMKDESWLGDVNLVDLCCIVTTRCWVVILCGGKDLTFFWKFLWCSSSCTVSGKRLIIFQRFWSVYYWLYSEREKTPTLTLRYEKT